jgi:tRNA pseudouridine38-40 synthase
LLYLYGVISGDNTGEIVMKNIKIVLEFDGKNYKGWQRQKNGITVQQVLEEAVESLTKEKISIIGSSRTDSGVHAKEYVANFLTSSSIPGDKFYAAINAKLPEDIVIINSEEVDLNFNARYCSLGKTYCYTILNRKLPPALYRDYVYHVREKVDCRKMKAATKYFLGKHDFSAFKSTGSSAKTSVRTINELNIEVSGDIIKIYINGDGFLYNMVRIIVGTLLQVGLNKTAPEMVEEIINSKDRRKSGKCVPAKGLCLEKVYY